MSANSPASTRSVAVVSLGCARNDVDSEELAGRLAANGWSLVADPAEADVALVNTCGFVEQAKKDSIDTILATADLKESGRTQAVVAVGCLAERYGADLAAELPEADAVLGFDSYEQMSAHLTGILAGEKPKAHVPHDRRTLLPLSPVDRQSAAGDVAIPGHAQAPVEAREPAPLTGEPLPGAPASGPRVVRSRLDDRPWAPLKIASGCDRRCAFCAIPAFRGSFVSRRPTDVLAEARWLAEHGVSELFLVSENSTSYGKDLGDLRLLDTLLPELTAIDGVRRVRVSYLQPAETRPDLLRAMTSTPGVVPYFDLSFQHASGPLLRRMRRFGDRQSFLQLIAGIRELAPEAGIRSNVIVGFPGESEDDIDELAAFLGEAQLDVCGVFGYSDEDGTEAENLDGKLPEHVVAERVERISALVEETNAQRAADRIGSTVEVLVEGTDVDEDDENTGGAGEGARAVGRAAHQGPEVDGVCLLPEGQSYPVGTYVRATVVDAEGVDLMVEPL